MTATPQIIYREFNPFLSEHQRASRRAKDFCQAINATRATQVDLRAALYQQLFGKVTSAHIEPNFFCDYGRNIFLGEHFYANHNCVFLDGDTITIGDKVMLGPNVHLYTSTHPIDVSQRLKGTLLTAPIVIEDFAWIGGNSVIMPGVTIGKGSVIGAGSLVTESIPAGVIAVGSPCRVLREITAGDISHNLL